MLKLKTEARVAGKARVAGFIPAVVYGPKIETAPISISQKDFQKMWKSAGESTVVTLEGSTGNQDVLIHEIVRHPVTEAIIHVDFYAVDQNKAVEIDVPIEFIGVSPAVKDLGGILMKVAHEIGIAALPKDLPHGIEVDISSLVDFDAQIKASDIKLPPGVTLTVDPDEVIALVAEAKEEVEEAPTEIDMESIGLSEQKGKKEEEEIPADDTTKAE